MSISQIDLGTAPDATDGDTHRQANTKTNANMSELEPGVITKVGSFTLEDAHANKTIFVTGTGTITLPPSLQTPMACTIINVGSGVLSFSKGAGVTSDPDTLPDLDNSGDNEISSAWVIHKGADVYVVVGPAAEPVTLGFALSDEDTDLAAGTAVFTWHMPYAMVVSDVRIEVNAAPTGSGITVDINEAGTSVLSTKATIDATEETSATAAAPPVLSDNSWADAAKMTADIDAVGSTTPGKGLKLWVYGYKV